MLKFKSQSAKEHKILDTDYSDLPFKDWFFYLRQWLLMWYLWKNKNQWTSERSDKSVRIFFRNKPLHHGSILILKQKISYSLN